MIGGRRSPGFTLVECAVMLPTVVVILALVGLLVWQARGSADGREGSRVDGLIGLERLRRDVWECRAVLYPDGRPSDFDAPALVVRTLTGDLVAFGVKRGRLVRRVVLGRCESEEQTVMTGVRTMRVRRVAGGLEMVRVGVSVGSRGSDRVVVLSAGPLWRRLPGDPTRSVSSTAPESDGPDLLGEADA